GKNDINTIAEDKNGFIWSASEGGGLYKLDPKTNITKTYLHDSSDISSLSNDTCDGYIDKMNNVWTMTYGYLGQLDQENEKFIHYKIKDNRWPVIIYEEENGDFWLIMYHRKKGSTLGYFTGKTGEIIMYEPNTENEHSLQDNPYSFLKDRSGTYWVGTWERGCAHLIPANNRFSLYKKDILNFDSKEKIFSFYQTGDTMWIGTDKGLTFYNSKTEKIKKWSSKNGLLSDWVFSFLLDKNDHLWIGTSKGLCRMNIKNGEIKEFRIKQDTSGLLLNKRIHYIFQDSKNNIWICVWYHGLVRLVPANNKSDSWQFYHYKHIEDDPNSLGENRPMDIFEDRNGKIWIATQIPGGLNLFRSETNDFVRYKDWNKRFHSFFNIEAAGENKFWVGGYVSGLHLFDTELGKGIKNYSRSNGSLPEDCIYSIVKDRNGILWLNTEKGLCSFNPKTEKYRLFTEKDGLVKNNVVSNLYLYLTRENKIFYGGTGGFHLIQPDSLFYDTIPPVLRIITFKLFNERVLPGDKNSPLKSIIEETKELVLKHNQNVISLEYAAMHYSNPDQIEYAYKLEGIEDKWQYVGNKNTVNYSGLAPGDYTFNLKAKNCDGIWSKEDLQLKITILPPWWRTIIAYISYVVLLLIIIYSYIKYREKALRQEKKILEQKVEERTKEVVQQKDEIQEKNEALKEQQEEILTANEELVQQKEEIQVINENLQQQNEEIVSQRDEIEAQRNLALEQKDQIEAQSKSMTDSIQYAKRIQTAMLPPEAYIHELLHENFILYKPRDVVSGDFYWVKQVNQYIILVAADCTGHGVPGAFMSMLGVSFLNEIVQQREITQANQVLNELRRKIKHSLRQHGKKDESKDGMDIAICAIDTKTNKMQYSGAFNPLILIKYKKGKTELTEIKADRMPVGIYPGREESFTNHEIQLEIGHTFYIFTDGYPDQLGGEKGKKFMTANFKKLLLEIQDHSMAEQKEILERRLADWMGSEPQVDDILVIGVRIE
ncbi:two-component regulator propeller domain-containing protein, partial [Bacteroidota bacterium]